MKVRSEAGIEGLGFCYVGTAGGHVAEVAVEELLSAVLLGQESHQTEGLWEAMYREALLHGRAGSVMRALSALDIALWDLNARQAGLALYSYLGHMVGSRVPAYASGGYYWLDGGIDALRRELAGYVEAGFKAVKIKVGRLGLQEEEQRLGEARRSIGPEVRLMLDANNAWRDLPTALAYCRRFEKYNPYWIEEPFSPDDIDNHRRLAALCSIPVATGEIEAGRWRFKELLERNAAMILQTDACVCGGITEWRRIAQTAASFGVTVSPHWFHDLHIHLVASSPNARYVEFFPDDRVLNFRRLINRQVDVVEGELVLPERAGLGFEFDEDAVNRFQSSRGWRNVRFEP